MTADHEPELLRLPSASAVVGRRRSAPKLERSSDLTRARGWLIGSLTGGLGLLAALLIDLGRGVAIGPSHPISRPHQLAGLDCASCHGDGRPRAADERHDPADACVGCHTAQRSIRAGHARLLGEGTLRCTDCHRIHTAMGGVAFEPGQTPIRWRNGDARALTELEPLAGEPWPGRARADVALVELAACDRCHDLGRADDPMAHCVLAGHGGPTDPAVCFDEHTPLLVAAGTERAALWELSREAAALPGPAAGAGGAGQGGAAGEGDGGRRGLGLPGWLALSLGGAALGYVGTRRWADRRDRVQAGVVASAAANASASSPTSAAASLRPAQRRRLPTIDATTCIGCSACVDACPYDVLELRAYVAVVARPDDCCGLTLCEQRCPNGSLVVHEGERIPALPRLDDDLAAQADPRVFLAGDVTGLPLIRNAINQGAHAVAAIARSLAPGSELGPAPTPALTPADYELVIVGAGPAGISAALEAKRRGLRYLVVEQHSAAASIRSFPRGKLVFDQPLAVPLVGELWLRESSKEELLGKWLRIIRSEALAIREGLRVDACDRAGPVLRVEARDGDGSPVTLRAARVLLACGRRGTPRQLDAPIAEPMLDHVHYSLADARSFAGRRVCVVGLGDVAMEAAIGLAQQPGTEVVLSYRGEGFKRGKRRNIEALGRLIAAGRVEVRWATEVLAVDPGAVRLRERASGRELREPADAVFVLIGNLAPTALLAAFGVTTS